MLQVLSDFVDYFSWLIYGSNYKVTICNSPNAHLKNPIINITPDVIKKGENINVNMKGDLDKPLLSGEANVIIKLNGTKFITNNYNLCDQTKCPLNDGNPGPIEFTFVQSIPEYAFPGKYNAEIIINDQDNEQVICFDIEIKL